MIESKGHALEQALAYYRAPAMLSMAVDRPLPEDVIDLLRLAAGDETLATQMSAASGETPGTVVDAAVFFVQQVLFAPGADSHRILGVNPEAPESRIKENYRWLVRWLHPDRNQDDWDNVYAERVNRAWQDVRRRSGNGGATAYAPPPVSTPRPVPSPGLSVPPPRARIDHGESVSPMISSRTVQRLPAIVLGGLGMVAGAALMLMWYAKPSEPIDVRVMPERVAASDESVESPLDVIAYVPYVPPPEPAPVQEPVPASTAAPAPGMDVAMSAPVVASPPTIDVAPRRIAPAPSAPASAAAQSVAQVPAVPETKVELARVAPTPASTSAVERGQRAQRAVAVESAVPPPMPAPVADIPPAPAPPVASGASPIADEVQGAVIASRFASAYNRGDINALMHLFTRDARNDRGGRDAIVYDYQSLFSDSSERSLELAPSGWVGRDDSATLITRYVARVKMRGKLRTAVSSGGLRFDLRQEGNELRISRISIDSAAN